MAKHHHVHRIFPLHLPSLGPSHPQLSIPPLMEKLVFSVVTRSSTLPTYHQRINARGYKTYRRQDLLAPESPTNAAVNTLGLSPARVDAHKPVTLVTAEVLGAYESEENNVNSGPRSVDIRKRTEHVAVGFRGG